MHLRNVRAQRVQQVLGKPGEGDWSWGLCRQPKRSRDSVQNAVEIFAHLVIPESDDAKAIGCEAFCPCAIIGFLRRVAMLIAIEFDDQFCLEADEIDDIRPDWLLTAKLESVKLPIAQGEPQLTLDVGLLPA